METTINQDDIQNYLARSEDFWTTFHQSLHSPNSSWSQYKNVTLQEWKNLCYPNLVPYLKLLFEYPVLKREYAIAIAQGSILTNYRLIMNDAQSGKHIIPLNKLIHYGWKEIGKSAWEKRNVNFVEYEINDKQIKLEWTSIDENIVNAAAARGENINLNQVQEYLLTQTFFDIKNKYSLTDIPQVEMPEFVPAISTQQTTLNNETLLTTPKRNTKKIIKYSIAAVLFFGLFKFCNSIDWNSKPSYTAPANSSKDDDIYSTDYSYTCKHCGGNGQRLNQLTGNYGKCSSCNGRGKVNKWQYEHQAN